MKIGEKIYLDHQASCPLSSEVLDRMLPLMSSSVGNPHSAEHAFGWEASCAVSNAAEQVAALIGADPDEIFFTSGATEANNLAIKGYFPPSGRSKIVTTAIEHKCVIESLRYLAAVYGAQVTDISVDAEGRIDLQALSSAVCDETSTIAVIGAHNEIGTLQDLESISAIARRSGARFHIDLAQAVTAMPLSSAAALADTISLSAHKYYGPMGIGCLYVKRSFQQRFRTIMHGGGQQNGLRSGTLPTALCVGMGAASMHYTNASIHDRELKTLRTLNERLWTAIKSLPFETALNGPPVSERHPGNLNVSFLGFDAQDVIQMLQPRLAVSTGSACTSGTPEPSYVLRALRLSQERAQSAIRLSVGRLTSESDIDEAADLIDKVLRKIRHAYM